MNKREKYLLTKEMLFAKFDGRCALCGYDLGERWCIWEIEPDGFIIDISGALVTKDDGIENKLPACISCNATRGNHSIRRSEKIDVETFRRMLYHEFDFLRNYSMGMTYYQKALRYGLIEETGRAIVFHFEKMGIK